MPATGMKMAALNGLIYDRPRSHVRTNRKRLAQTGASIHVIFVVFTPGHLADLLDCVEKILPDPITHR